MKSNKTNSGFIFFDTEYGQLLDTGHDDEYRTQIYHNSPFDKRSYNKDQHGQCFIYVMGRAIINFRDHRDEARQYDLTDGMFMSLDFPFQINGRAVIIQRVGYHAPFTLGGPIEEKGRLKYIDGCTDSLLVPPVLKGDACLNHLHFPAQIDQTMHTHPTIRCGMIAKGNGFCRYLDDEGKEHVQELYPGLVWVILPECPHAFKTVAFPMDVIAYHPDSDWGPEHEEHPMLNRTYVDGESAKNIDSIRTQEL